MRDFTDDRFKGLSKRGLLRGLGAAGLVGFGATPSLAAGTFGLPEYTVDPSAVPTLGST